MARMGALSLEIREALLAGRFGALVELLKAEGEACGWLAQAPAPVARVAGLVADAGGAAIAAPGGVIATWAPPGERGAGPREAVLAALKAAGVRPFPARVDLLGLDVEARA
jgi:hypothetical protein